MLKDEPKLKFGHRERYFTAAEHLHFFRPPGSLKPDPVSMAALELWKRLDPKVWEKKSSQ